MENNLGHIKGFSDLRIEALIERDEFRKLWLASVYQGHEGGTKDFYLLDDAVDFVIGNLRALKEGE